MTDQEAAGMVLDLGTQTVPMWASCDALWAAAGINRWDMIPYPIPGGSVRPFMDFDTNADTNDSTALCWLIYVDGLADSTGSG